MNDTIDRDLYDRTPGPAPEQTPPQAAEQTSPQTPEQTAPQNETALRQEARTAPAQPQERPAPVPGYDPYAYHRDPYAPYPPRAQSYERTWEAAPRPVYPQGQAAYPYPQQTPSRQTAVSSPEKAEKKQTSGVGKAIAIALVCALLFSAVFSAVGAIAAYSYVKRSLSNTSAATGTGTGAVIHESEPVGENPYSGTENATAVSYVVDKVADSVVEISTEAVINSYYYGRYISSGAGSGVIISEDGYIITNNHVVENTDTISVLLRDGTKYKATLVGTDEQTDIAVIKIEATGLTYAVMGDSSKLIVGETAIAIGNPLGQLGGTVTDGIISALDRDITIDDETMTLIQTNVAINPGNSGGGLFNIKGELIGIVNAKKAGTTIEGLSFAIPINTAKATAEQILKYGYVRGRAILGVDIKEITTASEAWSYRVGEYGAYVTSFSNGDFKEWDRIAAIDGNSVSTLSDIRSLLKKYNVGDTVTVTVSRNGRLVDLRVTLIEATSTRKDSAAPSSSSSVWDIFEEFGF